MSLLLYKRGFVAEIRIAKQDDFFNSEYQLTVQLLVLVLHS